MKTETVVAGKDALERVSRMFYEIRTQRGLSQREVAAIAGMYDSQVWRIEKGRNVTVALLCHLAKGLGYEVEITLRPVNTHRRGAEKD